MESTFHTCLDVDVILLREIKSSYLETSLIICGKLCLTRLFIFDKET